jgi:hypothetical protein
VTFFCKMVNIPVGVAWLFVPVLTVETPPMRTPLRYTYILCSGRLTMITTGPAGEISGCQT